MKIAASTRFARTLLAVTTAFVAACSGAPAVSHTGATPAPPQARAFAGEVAAEVERQAGAIADRAAEADAIAAEAEAPVAPPSLCGSGATRCATTWDRGRWGAARSLREALAGT